MTILISLLLIVLPLKGIAQSEPLYQVVQGNYLLVGKGLDSTDTYHGTVVISVSGEKLMVMRTINGITVSGVAAIESALSGETKVLRIRFTEDDVDYEETCMISNDLDNHARISCYLYRPDQATTQPGIEALFHDHTVK